MHSCTLWCASGDQFRFQNVASMAMTSTPRTRSAVSGGSFPVSDAYHSVQECIEEGLELDAGTLYLTHLAMHYDEPVTLAELEEYLQQYGGRVKPAADGLTIGI